MSQVLIPEQEYRTTNNGGNHSSQSESSKLIANADEDCFETILTSITKFMLLLIILDIRHDDKIVGE